MVCFGSVFIRVTLVQSIFVMRVYIPSRSVVSSFVIGHTSALYNIIHRFHGANTLTVMEHVFHFVTEQTSVTSSRCDCMAKRIILQPVSTTYIRSCTACVYLRNS